MKSDDALKFFDRHRHATWLELFFDLVFVAAIGRVVHSFQHLHHHHIELESAAVAGFSITTLWWIWSSHTLHANRFDTDSNAYRLASLAIMLLLVIAAGLLGGSLDELDDRYGWFVLVYLGVRAIQAAMYVSAPRKRPDQADFVAVVQRATAVGVALAAVSIVFDGWLRYVVFLSGIGAEVAILVWKRNLAQQRPIHLEHLVERIGLLSIIMLGESIISEVAATEALESWSAWSILAAISGFGLVAAIWWIYFDSFAFLERAKAHTNGYLLVASTLPLMISFGLIASAIRFAILNGTGSEDPIAQADFRWLTAGGVMLFYLGKQVGYFAAFPPMRKPILMNSSVCILLTIVATFLPNVELTLAGMLVALAYYVGSNMRFTLTKDVSAYLYDDPADLAQVTP